jgi:hypothetical protein
MKTDGNLYLTELCLAREIVETEAVMKIKTQLVCLVMLPEDCAVCEVM